MSLASLLLESETGVISKVVGVHRDMETLDFIFKVEHKIPKDDVRRVIRDEDMPPVERPFLAADIGEYEERMRTGNFDNSTIEDVIHFLSNMPGGGALWLVGSGYDENLSPKRRAISRGDLEKLYQATIAALFRKTYEDNYDPENHTMIRDDNPESELQVIDQEAWEAAERACLLAQRRISLNQQKYFGGDKRTGRGSPDSDMHREHISAQLTLHYLEQMKAATYSVVRDLLPQSLHNMFFSNARYSGDSDTTSFDVITPQERRSKNAQNLRVAKAKRRAEKLDKYVASSERLRDDLGNLVSRNFDDDPQDDLAFAMQSYIMYTELEVPAKDIAVKIGDHFVKSLKMGYVHRIEDDGSTPLQSVSWNTGIEGLSDVAETLDKLSLHVTKSGQVLSRTKQQAMNRDRPGWDNPTKNTRGGGRRGSFTWLIRWGLLLGFAKAGSKLKSDQLLVHEITAGPHVLFTVPRSVFE